MLLDEANVHKSLRQIVKGFAKDPHLQEDLMQECLVCLWRAECETPGRTRSWYLQNCRFRIQHFLAAGSSVDSLKRDQAGKRVSIDATELDAPLDEPHTNGELHDSVSFRDLVSVLACRLDPYERLVLQGLADGLPMRELAARLNLSYPTALKCRRRIADLAAKLGVLASFPLRGTAVPKDRHGKQQRAALRAQAHQSHGCVPKA